MSIATVLGGIVILAIVLAIVIKGYFIHKGTENIIVRRESRSPLVLEDMDKDSLTLSTTLELANTGKQSGFVLDCLARQLLPYEQYDGVEVRAKVELNGKPRADEYFEALVVEHQQEFLLKVIVKLTARKGQGIKEAMAHMVDLPIDIIYQHFGRTLWRYSKVKIVLTAEELSELAGVKLLVD